MELAKSEKDFKVKRIPEEDDVPDGGYSIYINNKIRLINEHGCEPKVVSLICKYYKQHLNKATDKNKIALIYEEITENCEYLIQFFLKIATFNVQNIENEAINDAVSIVEWFFTNFKGSGLKELFGSENGSFLFQTIKKHFESNFFEVSTLSLLSSFIRNDGEINPQPIIIHFNYFVSILENQKGEIDERCLYLSFVIFLLGTYVNKFLNVIPNDLFVRAYNISVEMIGKSPQFKEGALSFWIDCLCPTKFKFISYMNETGNIGKINELFISGTKSFVGNVCIFMRSVAKNLNQEDWESIFFPNINWPAFCAITESPEFDMKLFAQCVNTLLLRDEDLVPLMEDTIHCLINYILDEDNVFDIREEALFTVFSNLGNMPTDSIIDMFSVKFDEVLADLVGYANGEQIDIIIETISFVLSEFEKRGDESMHETAGIWEKCGLTDALRDVLKTMEDDYSANLCEALDNLERFL